MRKRSSKKRSSRFRIIRLALAIGILLTMAIILLVSTLGNQDFGPMHKIAFESAAPFQKFFANANTSLLHLKKKYLNFDTVEENKRLWTELEECRNSAFRNREAVASNARMRRLLDFKETSNQPVVAATIVGKDPSLWFRTVTIDRGTSDGVSKGMPVVSGAGIVGQIFATAPDFSKVLLAIAPSSAIDVVLQKSRIRGILKGTGTLTYRLDYILKTVEVEKGEFVVTAGFGGIFPTGLPVGTVTGVTQQQRGMFQEIEVTPATDFLTLEEVLVIQKENPFSE